MWVALVAVMGLLVACGDDGGSSGEAGATTASVPAEERYKVDSSVEVFVDETRSTPANGSFGGAPSRTLETKLYWPVVSGSAQAGDGFPLIVFAHGSADDYGRYEEVLEGWAAEGYVVAAPNFPLSRKDAPGGATLADLDNQPGDVQFVMEQVRRLADQDHEVAGLVGDQTALAGKSFGAVTTLSAVFGPDPIPGPVEAVVSMAGALGDTAGLAGADIPLLLIHGDVDERVPYQSSVAVLAAADPPKFLLTLLGEGHTGAYIGGDSPVEVLVFEASLEFFDAYLKGDDVALKQLTTESDIPGLATLQADPG